MNKAATPRRGSKKHNWRMRAQVFPAGQTRCWQGDTGCQFDRWPRSPPSVCAQHRPAGFPLGGPACVGSGGHGPCYRCPVRGLCKQGGEQRAKGGASDTLVAAPLHFIPREDFFFFLSFLFLTNWLLEELQAFPFVSCIIVVCCCSYCALLLLALSQRYEFDEWNLHEQRAHQPSLTSLKSSQWRGLKWQTKRTMRINWMFQGY